MAQLANLTTTFAGESASFLSAINASRGGLRSLISQLDPASAATARFNKQQETLDNALHREKITLEQHATLMGRLRQRYDENMQSLGRVNAVNGQARAGMQQLSYQLNDVATMWSLGARPMQIFASQSGQVIQAMQLMGGEAKGLLGLLGGPWGMAFTTAAVVAAPLIGKLLEGGDAAKDIKDKMAEAADGADAFGDAQSSLGKVVDLTTGKLKSHNDVLKATIRLQAILSQQNADEMMRTARNAMDETTGRRVASVGGAVRLGLTQGGGRIADIAGRLGLGFGTNLELDKLAQGLQRRGDLVLKGKLDVDKLGLEDAVKTLQSLNESGKLADDAFRKAAEEFTTYGKGVAQGVAAGKVLDAMDGKGLDPRFSEDAKPRTRKGPKDRTEQYQRQFESEVASQRDKYLQLLDQLTGNAEESVQIEQQRIANDHASYVEEVRYRQKQKELTKTQADQLIAADQKNAEMKASIVWQEDEARKAKEAVQLRAAQISIQFDNLNLQYSVARTEGERRKIALKLFDLSLERVRIEQEAIYKSAQSSAAEAAIAKAKLDQLDTIKAMQTASINREHAAPIQRYLDSIPRTAAEANEAYQLAAADGLASFNDGLANAITGSKSLGDVFHNTANQIIADIARIMIQRSITKPLANALFGGGGGGLDVGSITKMGLDALDNYNFNIPGFANGGSFMVGGNPGIDNNILSVNGVPRARVSASERLSVGPSGGTSGQLVIALSPGLEAEWLGKSANQSVQILRAAAPGMLNTASMKARRDAARPMTPGGDIG